MRISTIAVSAALLALALPAAALAQTAAPPPAPATNPYSPSFYGTLGYMGTDIDGIDLSSIQARLGARFGRYIGIEGEGSWGVDNDKTFIGGNEVKLKQDSQEAIYGVGFLPIMPNFDLLARVGYGHTSGTGSVEGVTPSLKGDSWNYGVGGQYLFDGKNGVRVDYTRESFQARGSDDANVWSVAYVRKF